MGNAYLLERKEIVLNPKAILILEKKSDDYVWVEVTYKSQGKEIFIGSVFTYNFGVAREWLEYNNNVIALMREEYGYNGIDDEECVGEDNYGYIGPYVKKMFDINSESFVSGTYEQLLEKYDKEITMNKKSLRLTRKSK